ncbi:MAG: response regulator transcription factor [Rhodopirellula sp.]|nr:response regulator transcription factor [Rhodopirellula sp.]
MKQTSQIVNIVDDDPVSRVFVGGMIRRMNLDSKLFESADEFLEAYDGESGCLVTDMLMPGRNAVELLDVLQERDQLLPTIVLTAYAEVPAAVQVMQRGAVTMLEKPCNQTDLWSAIQKAFRQDVELRSIREERTAIRSRVEQLTSQERSMMKLIVDGVPNKEIALRLDMGLRTVEGRRRSIFKKMHVDSVARLVQDVMIANKGRRPVE